MYITSIQVNNKEVEVGTKNSPLQKSITNTKAIELEYNQSYISLYFSALSFAIPEMIRYAYKMEGLGSDWVYINTDRRVDFTELAPGEYVFRVKAVNDFGIESEEANLIIRIHPPWWATTWAYGIYFAILIISVLFILRTYHNRVKFQNEIKFARHQYEKEKEILQSKIDFFTNVAHEIRSPLTLIIGPLEKVIDETSNIPQIKTSLELMERNTTL